MEHISKILINICLLPFYSPFLFAQEEVPPVDSSPETNIVDTTYDYLNSINSQFCRTVIWFDNFFIDDGGVADPSAGTRIRWYNDISWSDLDGLGFDSTVNLRVNLPKVSRKLKLVFESGEEDDPFDLSPTEQEETQNSLGLDYDVFDRGRGSFAIKVSLRPSIEGRYIYTLPLTERTLARFTQKLYQREKITGESTQVDLDYSINPKFLFRWTNFAKYESDINGFKFGSGFTLFHYISDKQAINYKANISSLEKPYRYINNSHLSMTYRHNYLRKWFFYEITPALNWNKTADTERIREATITLRLEVLFSNI